jgi:DeoR/GlpR family transcriptional regulator of sugar metabolism
MQRCRSRCRAEEVIFLVDSSKFQGSGNVVCDLKEVDIVVTDQRLQFGHGRISVAEAVVANDAVVLMYHDDQCESLLLIP